MQMEWYCRKCKIEGFFGLPAEIEDCHMVAERGDGVLGMVVEYHDKICLGCVVRRNPKCPICGKKLTPAKGG